MAPMTTIGGLSHLNNPLAAPEQLANTASRLDGIPQDLEISIRYHGQRLIQAAGILLALPQIVVAETIVIYSRFLVGPEGGSLLDHAVTDVVAASIYLAAKPTAHAVSPRQVLTVLDYLARHPVTKNATEANGTNASEGAYLEEGSYHTARDALLRTEAIILRTLGYQTHVALPHTLCINYLQTLEVFSPSTDGQDLARRTFAYLNTALFSPQLLYLTHQPNALAIAAIYLAAREVGVKLPDNEWWEVFDVDREELGFLVVGLTSMAGFAEQEARTWARRKVPMTVEDVQSEIETLRMLEAGE